MSADGYQTTMPARFRMYPLLVNFAEEFRATSVRLLAYVCGVGALALIAADLFSGAMIDTVEAAVPLRHRDSWTPAVRPQPAYAAPVADFSGRSESYEILRHAEGGRKDILRWSAAALFWLFGLVKPRSRNRSAPLAPERAAARPADTPKKRRGRRRRVAVAVLRTRGLIERVVRLALALLSAGLSQSGFIKATSIMSLEDVLKVIEKDTVDRRHPGKYHFSIFGTPSDQGTWGYRVEGHHVSLHFTMSKGKLAGTPTFFGANPHEVRQGPRAGLRVLAQEEDLGRSFMQSLDAAQQKTATVDAKAYADILTEASRKAALKGQPNGLPVSKLNARQKALLNDLMEEYVSNVPESVAAQRRDQIKKAGNNMFFAWAGPVEKNQPHYYRISSPVFLIEYDNTQNEANHSHTVWRDYEGDFGLDMLADHIHSSH